MADDIFLTEEEQVRQVKQWLKKNGPSILFGIVLGLSLIFGYNYYTDSKIKTAQKASAVYQTIFSSEDSLNLVAKEVDLFKSDYVDTPYAAKVVLLNAKRLAESGKVEKAIDELSWVINNNKEELIEHTARIRKAKLLILNDKLSEAQNTITVENIEGFESYYDELNGDIAAKNKQFKKAAEFYTSAINNASNARYNTYLQLKINKMNSLSK